METPGHRQANVSFHDRRLAERMEDPEVRTKFDRASREIRAIDAIVNTLDSLRATQGMSKAELAREIGKNPASVRRLLTAQSNPELRTVVAMADALDADLVIVPRSRRRMRASITTAGAPKRPPLPGVSQQRSVGPLEYRYRDPKGSRVGHR